MIHFSLHENSLFSPLTLPTPDQATQAREVLQQSLKSLVRREHIDVIVKFGVLEYKLGDAERGRTIFEQLVMQHPKRADVWNVYLDQELRLGKIDAVRALLERIITLPFNAHKMKPFFARYLSLETEHGTPERVDYVKEKARAFVSSLSKGKKAAVAEEEEEEPQTGADEVSMDEDEDDEE